MTNGNQKYFLAIFSSTFVFVESVFDCQLSSVQKNLYINLDLEALKVVHCRGFNAIWLVL